MNKLLLPLTFLFLVSCQPKPISDPLTGTSWGQINNPSMEAVQSSEVLHWINDKGAHTGTHFYDHQAIDGNKSLTIFSKQAKHGRWYTKVNIKPWSVYEFSGWIKTENLAIQNGKGAGFHLGAFNRAFEHEVEPSFLTGSNDWTEIKFQFSTGNQDAAVLECLFNQGGQASGQVWFDNLNLRLISSEALNPSVAIDINQESIPMQDYVYGQFIEHLGKCIYGGIWAEVFEDRKFYYAPNDRESPWKIDNDFEMDQSTSFVGEQTPVLVNSSVKHAILSQDGLGLLANMGYSGRVVLKAKGLSKAIIHLNWGPDGQKKQSYELDLVSDKYQTYSFKFQSDKHVKNAKLSIEPIGVGKLWVGTISLMPDNNVHGFRADVLELLKELNSPVYRWPGGNFVSGYDWKDGIGDPDKRPPRKNPAWTGVEHNDVGIHEFMKFCELLDTEPYIAVNAGLGGAEEARKQVEYCNGAATTPMGKWRTQNNHPAPWKVEWWSIGNEMYGGWQLGHMGTKEFVAKHIEFVNLMKTVDKDLIIVAVGDPGPWDEMILSNCSDHMDYISEHFYRQDWHGGGLMTHIRQIPDAIRDRAEIHRKYREEIPALKGKDIQICLDEWNYWYGPHIYGELGTRYYMRDALGIAAGFNEFSRQSDMIYMANYAQTVNVIGAIKATTTESVMASTGQAFKMYRKYFGYIPVSLSGDYRPLDVAATLSKDREHLCISLVNMSWESQTVNIEGLDQHKGADSQTITLSAPTDMAYNVPGQEETVQIIEGETSSFTGNVTVAGFEAMIVRIKIKD